VARRFAESNVARDDRLVDPLAEDRADLFDDLRARFVRSSYIVITDAVDLESLGSARPRMRSSVSRSCETPSSARYFALHRDERRPSAAESPLSVSRPIEGGTIDEDVARNLSRARRDEILQSELLGAPSRSARLGSRQVPVRRDEVEAEVPRSEGRSPPSEALPEIAS
jgi:hypothetical protein